MEVDDNGTILELIDTGGKLRESGKLEYYDGVIIPGLVLAVSGPLPGEPDPGSLKQLDSSLRKNGVSGAGVLIRMPPGMHPRAEKGNASFHAILDCFTGMHGSPVHYHVILELCPEGVLGLDAQEKAVVLHPEACTACMFCELHCPDLAIEVQRPGPREESR